jgi:hypothetical protein
MAHRSSFRFLGPLAALGLLVAGCGGGSKTTATAAASHPTTTATVVVRQTRPRPLPPAYPKLLPTALRSSPGGFQPVVRWRGGTAAWIARSPSGFALLSFDQRLLELRLHSGTIDAGAAGWRFGPAVAGAERRHLVAAINGGFRLSTGAGGFESYGRVAVPLRDGVGSIVTYSDGTTEIGIWHRGVPAPGKPVASVRQNLPLLIDNGKAAPTIDCVSCWGATLGGVVDPARSALGITADGRLIWAGGEHLTVADLAGALLGARVVRAVELDINPEWVAGYLYGRRAAKATPTPVPVVPGQTGIPGQFLAPWSRDFFTIVAR